MSKNINSRTLEIRLKRFQPSKMQTNRICIMVGKKGTGKSTLVEDIMWFQQHIPVGAIMSATEEANEAYSRMAPPLFIYKNFDADALLRLINRQKKMKHLWKENGDTLPFDHRAFVLMDDCMYDKKNFRGPLMRELFMNGRHWDLFVLITLQYVMDITPEIRTNTDYIFALKENIRKNRERLFNEFFGVFPNFAVFDALFLEVTQDWRCLVLDNTVPSTEIQDCVFWYKAEKRPPFRLGAEWFWDYSKQNARGKNQAPNEDPANQLEEMNQKAVRVVYEGQRQKNDVKRPPTAAGDRPSRVQFRGPDQGLDRPFKGPRRPHNEAEGGFNPPIREERFNDPPNLPNYQDYQNSEYEDYQNYEGPNYVEPNYQPPPDYRPKKQEERPAVVPNTPQGVQRVAFSAQTMTNERPQVLHAYQPMASMGPLGPFGETNRAFGGFIY